MDATMIDEHLENLDRRLTRVEQILPTLATKDDLTNLRVQMKTEIAAVRSEVRDFRDEIGSELRVIRGELVELKEKVVNLRMSAGLLDRIKMVALQKKIPYQKFIRQSLEVAVKQRLD